MPKLKQSSYRIIAILLTLFVLIALVPICLLVTKAEGIWSGDYEYTVLDESDKTAALTWYRGDGPDVIVPYNINEYTIVELSANLFNGNDNIETIYVADSVKRIGYKAFADMENLKSVSLPRNLEYLDIQAFSGCTSLEHVTFPITMKELPDLTFQNCSNLKSIKLPNGLTSIGYGAFYNCESLVEVNIPDSVQTIDDAFPNCKSLKSIELPDSIKIICSETFLNCESLETVSLPNALETIEFDAFKNCSSLKNIILPDTLTKIGSDAFSGCSSLTEISIPSNVETIATNTFRDCLNLSTVSLPNSLRTIHSSAFLNCPSLHELTIPYSVFTIKPEAIGYLSTTEPDDSFVIKGYPGTEAETYALQNSIQFVPLDDDPTKIELISEKGVDLFSKQYTNLCVRNSIWNPSDYLFKFIVYNNDSKQWYKLRDFGESNEFNWYTGPVGHKTLYVDIVGKEWYQNDPEFALKNKLRISLDNVVVTDYGLKVDSIVSSAGTELAMKTHTTLTATASNGVGDLQYKFIVHNEDKGQWYKIQDFSSDNTCDWYTGPAGHKTLYVDVRDANGVVVRYGLENIVVS